MDVVRFMEVARHAQLERPAAHICQRRLDGLLHDVAQRPCLGLFAFTGYGDRFDAEQLTAHLGPGKPRHHADLIAIFGAAEAVFANAVVVFDEFR